MPSSVCSPSVVKEIRELEPTTEGWAQSEPTGRVCAVCTCGAVTGFVHIAEALDVWVSHQRAGLRVPIGS